MARILIVDDDSALRESIAETVGDLGHDPVQAPDGEAALARLARGGIDVVLLDLRMPGLDGIEVLRRLRALPAPPPVAVLTAVPTAANTIEAMRLGAVDHLAKPVGRDDLAGLIARMLPRARRRPPAAPPPAEAGDDELVGSSAPMREVQKSIGRLADSEATVLITGETGTGKEVVARAIHRHGRRGGRAVRGGELRRHPRRPAGKPVVRPCPRRLHRRHRRPPRQLPRGRWRHAVPRRDRRHGPRHAGQAAAGAAGPHGGAGRRPAGGRSMCASWRPPTATCAPWWRRGAFREDLFYRIGVVPVHLAPLRERLSDILPLAEHFLARAGGGRRLSAEAAARLLAHPWPGNVRELRNAIERAAVLAPLPVLSAADFAFLAGEGHAGGAAGDGLAGRRPARRGRPAGDGNDPPRAGRLRGQPHRGGAAAEHPPPVAVREDAPLRAGGVRKPDGRRRGGGRPGARRRAEKLIDTSYSYLACGLRWRLRMGHPGPHGGRDEFPIRAARRHADRRRRVRRGAGAEGAGLRSGAVARSEGQGGPVPADTRAATWTGCCSPTAPKCMSPRICPPSWSSR